MNIQQAIENKISTELSPVFMQVDNESHMHSGPGNETHFKVTIVSDRFFQQTPVKRHQSIYQLLTNELQSGVHALALHIYTPAEWDKLQNAPESPACRGGSK